MDNCFTATTRYIHSLSATRVLEFFILNFKQHAGTVAFAFVECAHRKLIQTVDSYWGEPGPEEDRHKKLFESGSHLQNQLIRACVS